MDKITPSLTIEPLQGKVSKDVKLFRLRVTLSEVWSPKILAVKENRIAVLDEETMELKEEHVAGRDIESMDQLKEEVIWSGLWKVE